MKQYRIIGWIFNRIPIWEERNVEMQTKTPAKKKVAKKKVSKKSKK